MNSNNIGGATATPKSNAPCDAAHDALQHAQEEQAAIVAELSMRLDRVLRNNPPAADGSQGVRAVEEAEQSVMHGRFLEATARTRATNRALGDMLDRLTI